MPARTGLNTRHKGRRKMGSRKRKRRSAAFKRKLRRL